MVPWERRKAIDEDLIFQAEPGQLGQGEFAFDGDLLLRNPNALDDKRRPWAMRSRSCQSEAGLGV